MSCPEPSPEPPGPTLCWLRRDLRLRDHPALLAAAAAAARHGHGVAPLFVIDPRLWERAAPVRRAYLAASLRDLDATLRDRWGARLIVRTGDPATAVPALAREIGATGVHISADYSPWGTRRDRRVAAALGGIPLQPLGSPYAVAPGRVRTRSGGGYAVFTPFLRAWQEHGWRRPAGELPPDQRWVDAPGEPIPEAAWPVPAWPVGEEAAHQRWQEFGPRLAAYPEDRDRPDRPEATSGLSAALRFGEIHPRTLLADLDDSPAAAKFRAELAWREFHADQLFRHPSAAWSPLRPEFAEIELDPPGERFAAWQAGRTGFPIVDAGMRQLLGTGLMHNRVRMIVASFLVKDLHLDWRLGARHFLDHLADGDIASNQLNWQWVAGCGADAAPYFRVFNPTTQGRRFDPTGAYIRRWVPELREAADPHEPTEATAATAPTALPRPTAPTAYPPPIVDHAAERRVAIARWQRLRDR